MSNATSNEDPAPWWAWAMPWTAAAAGRAPWFGVAPQSLTQPINPGWTFGNVITVNNGNSSAPEIEREVVTRHSYGRQIGRLMEAVAALADATPKADDDQRIQEFRELAEKIDKIKKEAAPQRIERLRRELEEVKQTDKQGWAELREAFR